MFATNVYWQQDDSEAGGRMVTPRGYKNAAVLIFGGTTEGPGDTGKQNRLCQRGVGVWKEPEGVIRRTSFDRPHGWWQMRHLSRTKR